MCFKSVNNIQACDGTTDVEAVDAAESSFDERKKRQAEQNLNTVETYVKVKPRPNGNNCCIQSFFF